MLQMAAMNFLPRCTVFFDRIPIESLRIRNSNAMYLGKKFPDAIFRATNSIGTGELGSQKMFSPLAEIF